MMLKLLLISKRFLPTLFVLSLVNVSILGCAQKGPVQKPEAQAESVQAESAQPENVQLKSALSESCRSCHTSTGAAGAKDFSSIYANPKSHHPFGVKYPLAAQVEPKFNLPNGSNADVAFFDRNANGQPDSDEIMLFGANGVVTVECASCHKEHGSSPLSGKVSGSYLRFANVGSALCITCHHK
jgi:predicted small lipoprotein YifL